MTEKHKRILHTVALVSDTARNLTDDPNSLIMLHNAIEQAMALAKMQAMNHASEPKKSSNAKASK